MADGYGGEEAKKEL
jgi:hypothetical protein